MTECKREELEDKLWELVKNQREDIESSMQIIIDIEFHRVEDEHKDEVFLKNRRMALYGEMRQLDRFAIELRNLLKYMDC